HVEVTRNLVRRNMRCDNYCPRCGELDETVTHAIFECPPAIQAWSLSSTPSSPKKIPLPNFYANMDYLFWRKNNILESELDMDLFTWIIWYIWKTKNEKLFRGIDRYPLELVRFAKGDYQAWFDENETIYVSPHAQIFEIPQVLSLSNICMGDGLWTSTNQFSGYGWVWKIQLMGTQNLRRRETALHSELEALRWTMESMLQHSACQNFGTDCNDKGSPRLEKCFNELREQNKIADSLARTGRSFHINFCFIGCSIPVWLRRLP
ncbi:hypothetical protein N665_0158s0026, partial [Sinapis alba]